MENNAKTLLIGCGGSGIKTLLRLNELMASNSEFREGMAENIAYFVLDTDGGDLDNFEEMIKLQMGFATPPIVAKAHLTGGYHFLNEMVSPNFDGKSEEVTSLMKKYWWFNEDGVPFRGEDIKDLQAGAAQCCQVSYLATWNYMPKIEAIVKSLLQEIRRKNKSQANPLADLKVYIVAGLAGGTGRGSWTLVAFKVRECLLREGVNVPIDGIFFDATCYPNVTGDADQKRSMFVNSATAISELSSWIRLKKGKNSEYFILPSLDNPTNADAINFKEYLTTGGSNDVAPIQAAYVVFGGNGATAHLLDNEQYHNMAAAALYAMIVNAENTDQKNSNKRSNIGSFASATFEVDSIRIQTYLETAAQKAFLTEQCAEATQELKDWVNEKLGSTQSPAKGSDLYHLWIPAELTFNGSFSSMNAETSLLEVIMEAIGKKADSLTCGENEENKTKELKLTSSLREALDSQDVETVKSSVESLFMLENDLDDDTVKAIIGSILAERKLDDDNLAATLRKLVMDKFAPDGEQVSLRRAMLYADGLFNAFTQYSESLKSPVSVDSASCADIGKLIEAFQNDVVAKSGKTAKEVLLFGKPFNKDEIEELCQKFQYFASAAVFFRIREELESFFKKACKTLAAIRKSLEKMAGFLEDANKKLDANVTKVFGETTFDDIFDDLFTDSANPETIKNSIPKASDLKSLYYRRLKPIMGREELKKLLLDKDSIEVETRPIMECIRKELDNLLDIVGKVKDRKYDTEDDAGDAIPEKVGEAVMANVFLKPDPSGLSFTNKHFSFDAVLKKNREAWNELLKTTSQSRIGSLFDQFREYLGLEAADYEKNKNGLPSRIVETTLVKKMVLSLVTACNPWIELSTKRPGAEKQPLTCLVVLPIDISEYEADLKKEIELVYSSLNYNLSLEILHKGSKIAKKIPHDRILVYNSELLSSKDGEDVDGAPVEEIRSMDYWKEYRELLELAEDLKHDSAALFTKSAQYEGWVEKPRSFAYLAPFFTMNPFRKLRWHPWVAEDVDKDKARLEEIYKVLFYSFLGHAPAGQEDKIAAAKEAVKSFGCDMPLLGMGRGNHPELFYFLREPLEWDGSKMIEAMEVTWHTDDELENSINHVVEFLNEEGHARERSEGGKRLQESIEAGNKIRCALLAEADTFFANIPSHIGAVLYKEIVRQCCLWIRKEKEESKDPDDQQYWTQLFAFANNELKKLG